MDTSLREAVPLADYRLKLTFQNGSIAIVNMERQVRTIRFARIASREVFNTARATGDKIVWIEGSTPFSVYCNELLDAMMME